MSIGPDIKEVLDELGTSLTIYKWPGPTTIIEKVDHEFYTLHSSEFLRQFFSGVSLYYNTQVVAGDLVSAMGFWFIIATLQPSYFDDSVVDQTAAFYKCNCKGKLSRYSADGTRNADYELIRGWADITTSIYALQYENKFDRKQMVEEDLLAITIDGNLLFLPGYVVPKEGDRWYPDETNLNVFFRITQIDTKRLDNTPICILDTDERE